MSECSSRRLAQGSGESFRISRGVNCYRSQRKQRFGNLIRKKVLHRRRSEESRSTMRSTFSSNYERITDLTSMLTHNLLRRITITVTINKNEEIYSQRRSSLSYFLSPLSFSSYLRDNFPLKNENRRKIRSLYFMPFDKILLDLHTHILMSAASSANSRRFIPPAISPLGRTTRSFCSGG